MIKMKAKNISHIISYAMAVVLCSAGLSACESDDASLNEGTMVFELTENDTPVGGTQEFVFDTPRSYTIKAENVVSATTERPEGWVVKTNLRDRQCIIEPPMAAYLDGNESGSIVFTLTSPAGRTANYTVAVAAAEIRLDFAFENPGETKFAYASTRSYEFTANESFGGFDFQLPAGWTGSYKKGETSFTITSPGEDDEGAVLSGDLSVTPLSVRGQRGVTATFRGTAVDAHDPAMTLETDNVRFQFETPVEIGYTGQYVADIVVADKPEGWEVTPDVAGKKITITAPDADNHTAYGGQVTLKTYNELGDDDFAQTYTIDVRLDGIAGAAEAEAFRKAYDAYLTDKNPAGLSPYMQNGEIVLLEDIDFGSKSNPYLLVSKNQTFESTLNGLGHTVKADIATTERYYGILMHKMSGTAEIKNITVKGSIRNSDAANWAACGGVLSEAPAGARFTGVKVAVDFSYEPTKWSKFDDTRYGGIVGLAKGAVIFTDCHAIGGSITMKNGLMRYFGGLVGHLDDDNGIVFTDCSNASDILVAPINADCGAFKFIGGLIGGTRKTFAGTFTNCTNTGKITIDGQGKSGLRILCGGIAGAVYGTYENCVNRGAIDASTCNVNYDFYGGILGARPDQGDAATGKIDLTGCRNEADLTIAAHFVGGLVGSIEKCVSATIRNCTNTGHINMAKNGNVLGGIVAYFAGTRIEGCTNSGKLSGTISLAAGGISGRSDNPTGKNDGSVVSVVKDCTNTGDFDLTTTRNGPDGSGRALPIVAGVSVVASADENNVQYYSIENCKNTGTLKAEVNKPGCIQNVWAFSHKVRAADPGSVNDPTRQDAATEASQNDRSKITEILKNN